ncbi:ABC transporter substrate-binding protein [Clostridiaceae bacterium UIB06]|uniref:ABC transporter substrate-binding protein n=1 Tax=Clostridium thailandense TaxID=2794346 RepID=A0A949TIZ5_9CLOT|nr:ABC transporter substrate-binding protein [Clostridium thailandense]MBV7273714.1 ABC transporter substrate-binding protein [Clostridium thailandense]MCH5137506.1 ABC transporter substrate-binding protein [Clostridiaceae bacterium UIB06]
MKNKLSIVMLNVVLIIVLLIGCGKASNSNTKEVNAEKKTDKVTITDSSGTKVEVPRNINRIADAWGAHNAIVAMLGSGDKIVATTLTEKTKPWLFKVTPGMSKAVVAFNVDATDISIEELVKNKPDILFISEGNKNVSKISKLGIPVAEVSFKDFDSLKKCIKLTADALGEKSKKRAEQYISYLDDKLKIITDVTSKIPQGQKPKVLHLADLSPLKVDGKNTIIDSWIQAAGGVNAADFSGMKEVSIEQILKWNPDVIVVSSTVGSTDRKKSAAEILNNETWKKVKAVSSGKVYINPDGAFSWDRYSSEEALQIQWAAKIIYPEKFKDIDVEKETKWFYKTFFNYELSEDEVQKILNAEPPAK